MQYKKAVVNIRSLLACICLASVAGCASQTNDAVYSPALGSLRSEFFSADGGEPLYGSYLAATQAKQDARHKKSAAFFLKALRINPSSRFIADKAFFELLLAGHLDQAAALSATISTELAGDDNDIIRLLYVLSAFKESNWQAVRDRLVGQKTQGISYIFSPLLKAWSFAAEGDFAAAEAALETFSADNRLRPLAEEQLAYMLDYLQDYEAAEAQYLLVTAADPPVSLQPAIAYADFLNRRGERAKALAFMTAQSNRFGNPPFLTLQRQIIAAGGTPLNIATSPIKAAGAIFFKLANELGQGRSVNAAILYARLAAYLTPENSNIHLLLARLLERAGNIAASEEALKKVPLNSEARAFADMRRVEVLRSGGQTVEAERLSRELLVRFPQNAKLLIGLADLLRMRSEDAEALLVYSRAIAALGAPSSRHWFPYFARALVYEKLGDWPRAEQDLKFALTLSANEPTLLNYLGYTWIDRGIHIAAAKKMIEQASALRPEDGNITDSLGWVYFLTKDYQAAVTTLEKAVRQEPTDVTINDHLGDAYWRAGRKIEARFQWRHALENGAKDEERSLILSKLDVGLPEAS